jgi:hypothetical protein
VFFIILTVPVLCGLGGGQQEVPHSPTLVLYSEAAHPRSRFAKEVRETIIEG